MKKINWLPVLFLLTISSLAQAIAGGNGPKEEGIQFSEAKWAAILKQAKTEKKVIFLDTYASWCGPCKQLQKNVFTKKEVADYFNSKFINVKIDIEKGEGPALAEVYPTEYLPTLLFIDGNGKILKKVIGYQSPQELLAAGKSVR